MDSDSENASHILPHPRLRLARHHARGEVDAFAGYLTDSFANEPDEQDDQATPKLSNNAALAAETPASRLRALLSRVPNHKPTQSTIVPPSHSRFDLVDSDVDEPQRLPSANHTFTTSSSLSHARESLRDIFSRARREPGDTPQKDYNSKIRRNSFDELDSIPKKSRRSGKRKSLSDEEPEKFPSDLRTQGSRTMSIEDLRERLLMESQTQLQDQLPPSLYEHSDLKTQDMDIPQATTLFATSTPQQSSSQSASSQILANFPSHLDSHSSQSNLLDADSEMQRAMENVETDEEHAPEFDQVSFPGAAPTERTELPSPGSTSITPGRSRIPLTRSRLNSLDNMVGVSSRRNSGEHHRSVSRTSSIASTQSSMSFSDEAERIRERERDWNKPKPPVRPSTPELKQGHMHGRFSERLDSTMVTNPSTRRARTVSMTSLEDLSSGSIGSRAECREQLEELERERLHERERQWNKRRPRLSHPSPNSLLNHQERPRTPSLTHVSRPDSATSVSSATSLQRQHSFSPSSGTGPGRRESPSNPPEEYLHERERNWNSPRPRWLQNSVTSANGRKRADSLRSTGSSSQEVEYDAQPLSAPLLQSRPQLYHTEMQQPQSGSPSRVSYWSKPLDHGSHFLSPSRSGPRSSPSPSPGSRPNSRNSMSRPTQIPVRISAKSAHLHLEGSGSPPIVHNRQRGNQSHIGSHLRVNREDDSASQDRTPTIRTVRPPPLENLEGARSSSPQFDSSASEEQVTALSGSVMSTGFEPSKHRESPGRLRMNGPTSFLQTPPRPSFSSNGGSLDFQSPSPPRDLPELPGPPPMSDEETADLHYSSIAWESSTVQENVAENGNLTTTKTPRPPGAWMMTPAVPPPDHAQRVSGSVNETEYDGGLVTPVASLSRGTGLQTPVPPGAWLPTPATVRKSILKVRFEPSLSERELGAAAAKDNLEVTEQSLGSSLPPSPPVPKDAGPTQAPSQVRSCTPDLQPSIPKPRSPKSPRKSHKIRVLDAFGRETETLEPVAQKNEQVDALDSSTSRKNSIRIMDAMGREIISGSKNGIGNNQVPEHSLPSPPLDGREALVRVRQGLSDLAEEIDEINRAASSEVQDHRIEELDGLSRRARAKREELATRLYTAETDLKSKMQTIQKRASIVQSARRSWIPSGQWLLWLALAQVILTIFLYQFAKNQARDIFLSTYYDPFYPDLHLYTIRPDTTHHRISGTTWISLFDTFQHHGWRSALTVLCENFSIFLYDLRTRIWETWGEDSTQQVASWPPT